MNSLRGYILAGGRSTRFGSDKARVEVDGIPLLKRVADVVAGVTDEVTVVASVADQYADLGLTTIPDRHADGGPLAGLEAALDHASARGGGWIFLTSCDVVGLRGEWVQRLSEHCAAPAEFVAFRGQFWEPLLACYHVSLQPRVCEHLARGDLALWKLLEASQGVALPLPPDWPDQVQANTPAELASAVEQRKRSK